MLRTFFILLFVVFGGSQDVRSDSGLCRVPDIQNGDFGRYVSSVEFEKINRDEVIRHKEILTLRCHKDYVPLPRQNNHPRNGFFEEEITCEDGTWSKKLLCNSSKCGDPPRVKNGYPIVGNRQHSEKSHRAVVTYKCRGSRTLVEKGKVECHFGRWVGEPSECMDNCNTNDIKDYDGFEVRRNITYNHSETLDIYCGQGYIATRSRLFITCQNGKWEVPNDLCIQNSCSIPEVENGEIGRFQTNYTNRSYEEFTKFPEGKRVNHNETLYLCCQNGFFPRENSVIYFNNRFEIRCNNGTWSKLLQCTPAPCVAEPPKIDNGYPVIHNREHGYIVWYICSNDDTAVKSNVTCHFGSWIGNAPKCLESPCYTNHLDVYSGLKLPEEEFISHLVSFGVECSEGYDVTTSGGIVTCLDEKWIVPEKPCTEKVRCEEPQAPEHGTVRLFGDPKVGSLAAYSCDPGRKLYGASTTKCLITGQWTFDPPKCISFCSVPDVKNGEMGHIQNRTISRWSPEFKKFSTASQVDHNATLLLRCDEGFLPTDGSTIFEDNLLEVTCTDGTWSKNFWCKETSCLGDPPPIPNGEPRISSREHGQMIQYVCESEKYTKVTGHIICNFGTWTGYMPKCLDSPCSTKELNFPGLLKPTEEYLSSMESFDIVCENGFTKSSSAEKVTCNERKWDVKEIPCTENECEISRVNGGSVRKEVLGDAYWSWERYRYERKVSYEMVRNGSFASPGTVLWLYCERPYSVDGRDKEREAIKCSEGRWSMDLVCLRDPCSTTELNFPGLLKPTEAQLSSNESFDIVCENGFTKTSSAEKVMCIKGKWDVKENPCADNRCNTSGLNYPGLEKPQREFFESFESFDIICKNGFRKSTHMRVILCVEGKWNAMEDPCSEEITCSVFSTENGLNVSYINENKPGSWATFSCPSHMKLTGASTSNCQINGTWSLPQPYCQEITCPMFSNDNGLTIRYDNFNRRGSLATFSCSASAKLVGDVYSRCQNDGTWSKQKPYCEEPSCSIVDLVTTVPEGVIPDMTDVTGEFITFGSEMRLECENNLIPNGNSKATCRNNGRWEFGSFQCVPGCNLKIDPSSHLIIQPVKDSYRLGEFILLSCPPGEKVTNDVERLMCLGETWSDIIPDCEE